MSQAIQKNLQIKLALLYQKYGYNEFSFSDARDVLGVSTSYLGKVMSELCKSEWVSKSRKDKDNRFKYYKINPFPKTFEELR